MSAELDNPLGNDQTDGYVQFSWPKRMSWPAAIGAIIAALVIAYGVWDMKAVGSSNAQELAAVKAQIETLSANRTSESKEVSRDISDMKERLARVEQNGEAQLLIQGQMFEMLRDLRR